MFDIPVGFIPIPDTLTLVLIAAAVALMVGAAIWKQRREDQNEVDEKVEDEIAKRAARADRRDEKA